MKKLPIGLQDFKEIITEGYAYVDKTRYIHTMLTQGKNYFMSRPRRFGKTLTVSTLHYLFKGEKELFKDTWIYDQWDFKPHPVIRMSMTELTNESPESVRSSLAHQLKQRYAAYGLEYDNVDYKQLFSSLIKKLSAREKVVILIDEYDRPMLTHMGDPETAKAVRRIMQEFYLVIKDADAYLKMVFLTGITKISKAGIFSTLNHLDELTTKEAYASMLGYTREELEATFNERLEEGSAKLNISRDELLAKIKDYYNGFSFDGKHFVYNPFSILNFFSEYEFRNYWMQSGLPSSLAEYAKTHTLKPEDYLGTYLHADVLTSYEIEQAPPESFLFQSGYLTFKEKDPEMGYLLDYPNREVRDSFSRLVLESAYAMDARTRNHLQQNIIVALRKREFQP
ncbi:MAG: AAA family ATPase, partial [Treponema sp.]|nr:AAA family ATPase [Treponema sp.]